MFDLQVEAEALGCQLNWAKDNPPAVSSHPLANGKSLSDLRIPTQKDGRIGMMIQATRTLREKFPDIALYGLITGPFTLALHLRGTELFMDMYDNPGNIIDLIAFCEKVGETVAGMLVDAGCDIIAVVDPMTSQIGPEQFREFVTPSATRLFSDIRSRDKFGSFFVCGHAQQNIEAMCDCAPDNISIDENIPLDYVRDICVPRRISFGGNMQLTSVLLLGTETDAQQNALSCMDIGGTEGYLLAPGCDLPYATPPANIESVTRLVQDSYQQDIVRTMAKEATPDRILDMSDYGISSKVIVDVITLDSEACAPCQYMVESVKAVTPEFEGVVEWREHKIKYREALVFMTSLMVKNIPTICIDGNITFVSRIPKRDELIAAIQQRIYEKLRIKIQRRRASLIVLGQESEQRGILERSIEQAGTELGADIEIVVKSDDDDIRSYGVSPSQTPAVVMARYEIKSVKAVPDIAIIKEWIKSVL